MLFNFFRMFNRTPPTIKAKNITHKYLANAEVIAKAMGDKIHINPDALLVKNKKLFVLDFDGDKFASRAEFFGEEISSLLAIANTETDSVLIRLNSPGGAAHAYGYAASQIERLKNAGIHVTVAVDRIAASGGYMMACVADSIIAAPYAVVGSIGVVAEFPNFARLLKDLGVDYKQYTAGKFKRTVSAFADMTDEGEAEFVRELNDMHEQFKDHVSSFRKNLDMEAVANGKTWTGKKALDVGLIDSVSTSDEFILAALTKADVIKIDFIGERDSFGRMIGTGIAATISDIIAQSFKMIISNIGWSWR